MPKFPLDTTRFGALIDDLRNARGDAQETFDKWWMGIDPDWYDASNASWWIERAFLKLLVACEAMGLESLRQMVMADITEAKSGKDFSEAKTGPDEPYSRWLSRYSQHLAALETLGPQDQEHSITKDISDILQATVYSITDPHLFPSGPSSEDEVHRRIEGVLRCIFPDLKHKPALPKPIKNFVPDTGLPSIGTLVEYKFIDRPEQVSTIADEILADTRGYVDKDWHTFIFVIYETHRIKPKHEWNLLLGASGLSDNTSVIVLSGEPATARTPTKNPKAKPARTVGKAGRARSQSRASRAPS